jgi:hypothetical protein
MLTEIREHLRGTTSLKSVAIVLFDRSSLENFKRALAAIPD